MKRLTFGFSRQGSDTAARRIVGITSQPHIRSGSVPPIFLFPSSHHSFASMSSRERGQGVRQSGIGTAANGLGCGSSAKRLAKKAAAFDLCCRSSVRLPKQDCMSGVTGVPSPARSVWLGGLLLAAPEAVR
jgi:hypothetical protein